MADHLQMPPEFKGAAAAWNELYDQAAQCSALAAAADPDRLPVAGDYQEAREQLAAAVQSRAIHELDAAAARFSAAFDLSGGIMAAIWSGAGEHELALIGAVLTLRVAIDTKDRAVEELHRRLPDEG